MANSAALVEDLFNVMLGVELLLYVDILRRVRGMCTPVLLHVHFLKNSKPLGRIEGWSQVLYESV